MSGNGSLFIVRAGRAGRGGGANVARYAVRGNALSDAELRSHMATVCAAPGGSARLDPSPGGRWPDRRDPTRLLTSLQSAAIIG